MSRHRFTPFIASILGCLLQVSLSAPASASVSAQHQMKAADTAEHSMANMPDMAKKGTLVIGAAFAPNGDLWMVQQTQKTVTNQAYGLSLHISHDDGKSWQPERLLDTGKDQINIAGESNPKLLFGPNNVVLISYARPLGKKFTGEIRLLRSVDGGAHFAQPITLHQDRQIISHSFANLMFDGKGALHTIWLDSREMTLAKQRAVKEGKATPDYRGGSLYHNVSLDGGASFGPDNKLADYSCECCRIALSAAPNGELAVMWRQVLEENIRDHGFTVLSSPISLAATPPISPVRASYDNWKINACPHHGPALSMAANGGYHAVWFGVRDEVAQVRYGKLDSQGKPSGTVQVLPDDSAEHADLLSIGNQLAIVWRSYDGHQMHIKAWVSEDDGQHFALKNLAQTDGDSDYPRLLKKTKQDGKQQLFVIWNTKGKTYVEAL